MINIEWTDKNGYRNYDNLLSTIVLGEYIEALIDRECDHIEITRIDERRKA